MNGEPQTNREIGRPEHRVIGRSGDRAIERTRTRVAGSANHPITRYLALTFDDGPNDPDTERLLEILDRYGVKATFFMIGQHVAARPKIAEAVARAGHVIGNHTFTHPNLTFCSPAKVREEVEACERALTDAVGEHSRLFRPPHGGRRPSVLRVVRKAGLAPVLWSVTGYDWNGESASRIEANVVSQMRRDEIILLHDGSHLNGTSDHSQTLIATGNLIRRYRDQGGEFVTIPGMMAQKKTLANWRTWLRWTRYKFF
jgi:peptidoglycan/xylan/chitin deacetylase (PgdA/CDA1 family)